MKSKTLTQVAVYFLLTLSSMGSGKNTVDENVQLSAGTYHSCILIKDTVKCWGSNYRGQTQVPQLKNPKMLSAGGEATCALDDEGVKCWGRNTYGQTQVPQLKNPKMVSAGEYHTCALDDEGVKCWGDNQHGQTQVPKLKKPKMVTGGFYSCALDEEGVKCWGKNDWDKNGNRHLKVPQLKNPKIVSSGSGHACALDDEGVKCWGDNQHGQTQVPQLRNPKMVSAGGFHTCALDDEGVKCWGNYKYGQTQVPQLKNPKMVSAGSWLTCALDEEGVKCWGYNDYGQTTVPQEVIELYKNTIKVVLFDLASLDKSFFKLSKYVYQYKASFFKELARGLGKEPLKESNVSLSQFRILMSRYVYFELAGSVIETTHSDYVEENVLPNYNNYLEEVKKQMGLRSLHSVELNDSVFEALLTSSIQALRASKDYVLIEEEARELEKMLSELGTLSAVSSSQGFGASQARELLSILNSHQNLIDSFIQNPRIEGFGALLEKVRGYLSGKV